MNLFSCKPYIKSSLWSCSCPLCVLAAYGSLSWAMVSMDCVGSGVFFPEIRVSVHRLSNYYCVGSFLVCAGFFLHFWPPFSVLVGTASIRGLNPSSSPVRLVPQQ